MILLLFATGCRPVELVDAKKKRKVTTSSNEDVLDDNNLSAGENDDDFSAEKDEGCSGDDDEGDDLLSVVNEETRHFDALCYKDVRLMVVRTPDSRERDVLQKAREQER